MKRIAVFMLICLIIVNLAACGSTQGNTNESTSNTAETTSAPAADTAASVAPTASGETIDAASGELSFTYNGIAISFHAPAAPIVDALGVPMSYTEQASCAFEGLDKTYYYGSFYLDTYPIGEEDFVYGWWFADDSVATQEGIYIGSSQAEVEAAYGADAFNGTNSYIVRQGEGSLTVIVEDGVVTSIQYAITLD